MAAASTIATRTPWGRTSRRSASAHPSSAHFEAAYPALKGSTVWAISAELRTMVPRSRRTSGRKVCTTRTAPQKFTSITRCWRSRGHVSHDSSPERLATPALENSAVSPRPVGSSASTCSRAGASWSSRVTSRSTACMWSGWAADATSCSASASLRTVPITT